MFSSPKRRSVNQNMKISPRKLANTKRLVAHYSVWIGDGTVMFDIPIVTDRPANTESYTLPAKKCVEERIEGTILRAGYNLVVDCIARREPNNLTNEPLKNSRDYNFKILSAQTDNTMTANKRKAKLNTLCEVSTV